ncbi:MAG TPA: alpha/beta fold hydrolase [Kofleriaceae bacterium]|nr:alpha/beta fold hydrolase [Kofleriaceae bacterium]
MTAPELPAWLDALFPSGARRRWLDVGGVRMHVAEWGPPGPSGPPRAGDDRPAVVLVHGNPSWGLLWRKVVGELLADGVRIVVPDLIGLGLSDKPASAEVHRLEGHAAWFGRMLDEVVPGPFVLCAQDWGGPIALLALADGGRLARLRGLVLLNTVVSPPRPGFKATTFHRLARLPIVSDLLFRAGGFPQNVMTLVQGRRTSLLGAARRGYIWPLRRLRDRVAPLALARMVPDSLAHPSVPALERVQQVVTSFGGPIELVWGTRDPVLGSVVRHLERLLPSARVTRTDAGHFLQEEVPGPIADAIRRVLSPAGAPG